MILYDIESCPPFVHLSDLSQRPRICGYRIPDPEKTLNGFPISMEADEISRILRRMPNTTILKHATFIHSLNL